MLVSFTGSVMQNAALLWHVSLLVPPDRKGLALGLVGLVRVGPIIVFSLLSGVVADAWDRHRLMLFTQTSAAIVAAALALLAAGGLSSVWPIYVLAAVGSAAGEDNPAIRQLTDRRFVDTFRVLYPDEREVGTFTGFTFGRTGGPKIDFVLVLPGTDVLSAAIIRFSRERRYPSDHFPVVAQVRFGAAPDK